MANLDIIDELSRINREQKQRVTPQELYFYQSQRDTLTLFLQDKEQLSFEIPTRLVSPRATDYLMHEVQKQVAGQEYGFELVFQ